MLFYFALSGLFVAVSGDFYLALVSWNLVPCCFISPFQGFFALSGIFYLGLVFYSWDLVPCCFVMPFQGFFFAFHTSSLLSLD